MKRKVPTVLAFVACCWLVPVAARADTPVAMCVPSAADATITTPKADGSCPAGKAKRSLADQEDLRTAKGRIADLEAKLAGVTRGTVGGQPTMTFGGMNVRIVDGAGSTSSVNGRGNLFVGYNGSPGTQTGSHNVVVGDQHTLTSYGSLVVGRSDRARAPGETLLGFENSADHAYATVTGGTANRATGTYASVAGGSRNIASAVGSSIAGGCANVTGGATGGPSLPCDDPAGRWSTVAGGESNVANASGAHVSGGYDNLANGFWAAVAGGRGGRAAGGFTSVTGGQGNSATFDYSSVVGGEENNTRGTGGTILGGFTNSVGGTDAIVAGGSENQAVGSFSAVLGGQNVLVDTMNGHSP